MAESKEELKSLWMKVKEESEKSGLKLNFQKMKVMASSPITSWQIDGETMETVTDFIYLFWGGGGPKITAMTDFIWLWEAPKSQQMVTAAMKLKDAYSLEEKL